LTGDDDGLRRYLDEDIACAIDCRIARAALGKTLRSGFLDRVMMTLWCYFSLESIVCGVALDAEAEGADVKSCLPDWCYA
jgi:hypothetical protein